METSSRPLFTFLRKTLSEVKASDYHLSFDVFWYSSTWTYNENKF